MTEMRQSLLPDINVQDIIEVIDNPTTEFDSTLYFIYYEDTMSGPYWQHEIITLYLKNKARKDNVYIIKSDEGNYQENWVQLEYPLSPMVKYKFPQLFQRLNEYKQQKIAFPLKPPREEESSIYLNILMIFGRILYTIIATIILFHCIPSMLLIPLFYCSLSAKLKLGTGGAVKIRFLFFAIFYSGMTVTPFVVIYTILSNEHYNEIQSWMIGYIVWGIMSYISSTIYIATIAFEAHMTTTYVNNIILLIAGVDFGNIDQRKILRSTRVAGSWIAVTCLFPSLSSLLASAICGFIANYVLEEQFQLECSEDIRNEFCFHSNSGCCNIVSSHDGELSNSYSFLGGLASNIVASWGLIRICGYVLAHSTKRLAMYAQRKR
eukprot:338116_1